MYKRHQFLSLPQFFTICNYCLSFFIILQFIIIHKGICQTYEPATLLDAKVIWDMYENRKAPAGFDIEKARLAAIKLYQQLAEKNNADAQFIVAVYGNSSDFGSLTEKEIFDLLLKAANQGLPEAQYEVAMAYRLGRGIEINMQEFEKWLSKATSQGLPGAMLQYSYHVEKDHMKKIAYRQLAAIFEMLFTKQNDADWYNHIISHNSDIYFMGANYRECYQENENLFTQKFNQSCNNSHTYGIYLPELSIMSQTRTVRAQMEFNFWDGNLTKEQKEEVCKAMLSIPVRLVYQAENASIEDETTAIAIKASASQKEIKTDGESTIEISAQLYEYTPGDQGSSVPLAGKTLQFEINAFDGIRPGRLSSPSAITDRNGIATVTYTAPSSEELQKIRIFARNTTSIIISSPEFKAEDRAYIAFTADKGRVMAYPSQGIASSECIVPPDLRFPGLIEVYLDGPSQREHAHGEITFAIRGDAPKGKLRNAEGQTGTRVVAKLDENAFAKVQYFYDDPEVPTSAFAEEIDIFTKGSAIPLVAKVHVGLNLVFESAENLYEGQNISARELIPLKMRIKDTWHPELDLGQILHHWGGGGER